MNEITNIEQGSKSKSSEIELLENIGKDIDQFDTKSTVETTKAFGKFALDNKDIYKNSMKWALQKENLRYQYDPAVLRIMASTYIDVMRKNTPIYIPITMEAMLDEQTSNALEVNFEEKDFIMPNSALCTEKGCSKKQAKVVLCDENECQAVFEDDDGDLKFVKGKPSEVVSDEFYYEYMRMNKENDLIEGYNDMLNDLHDFEKQLLNTTTKPPSNA